MNCIKTESDLIAISIALIGKSSTLSSDENALKKTVHRKKIDATFVEKIRKEIAEGKDPLGDAFAVIRSSEERRASGAVYTPEIIIRSMINWAAAEAEPSRVLDPGAGSGRFLLAAADVFKDAKLVGIELDPLPALMLRANVVVRGLQERTTILVDDYRKAMPSVEEGTTLFIGNPPYVRHHDIGSEWKNWFSETAAQFDVKASKLAGLHIHFFVRTLQLAKDGDIGAFITSSEWLDVNYGSTLRILLAKRLGGVGLHVLDPKAMPFSDATTTGTITCFKIGSHPDSLKVRQVETAENLNCLSGGVSVPWNVVEKSTRWSTIVRPGAAVPPGYVELGELCRVHRGQVTGGNDIWIASRHLKNLPSSVLKAAVTKARDLLDAGDVLSDESKLKRVIDLPTDLDELETDDRHVVEHFLKWAKQHGADQSYIAKHRRAWWAVGLKPPAPIVCTYMARRSPAFVRNLCGAHHINIAHGLYPRQTMTDEALDGLAFWLRTNVKVESGRTYAGGLTKFEPKEVERLLIPKDEFWVR